MRWRAQGRIVGYYVMLWTVGIWLPTAGWTGWVIEQIEYPNLGAEETRTIQYIAKNRLKTTSEGNTFLMDFAKNLFIATDKEKRVYWSGTVDEYVQEVKNFQRAANDLAREQIEAAVKEMPPDRRKSMEDPLQQTRTTATPVPSQSLSKQPTVKVEPTADTAMLAGHKATKALVYADGKVYQEVWIAKGVTLKADLDLKRLRSLQAKLSQAIISDIPTRQSVEEDPSYEQMLDQGYPIKIVELGDGGEPESVTEVVRLEKTDIPEREFQVPEGYRRIDLRELFAMSSKKCRRGNKWLCPC